MRRQPGFLEGDRAAVLTCRAAALGVIDYSSADWQSPAWWKYWRYLVNTIDKQSDEQLFSLAFHHQLALVSNSRISAEDFSKVQKSAKQLFQDTESVFRPWMAEVRKLKENEEVADFKKTWEAFTGFSLDDADAKAEWEQQVKKTFEDIEQDRIAAETAEIQKKMDIERKIAEVKAKRRKQQGRA